MAHSSTGAQAREPESRARTTIHSYLVAYKAFRELRVYRLLKHIHITGVLKLSSVGYYPTTCGRNNRQVSRWCGSQVEARDTQATAVRR